MNEDVVRIADQHFARATTSAGSARVFRELAAFTRTVASSGRLAKALADGDVSAEAKCRLVEALAVGRFSPITVQLLGATTTAQRVSPHDLPGLLAELTERAAFADAEKAGELNAVGDGLHEFAELVQANPELRSTITDSGISGAAKIELLADLLDGKVNARVVELLSVLIALDHGHGIDERVEALAVAAAGLNGKMVAYVTSAVELDAKHQSKLVSAIGTAVDKPVEARFNVDPTIVGSVVVRVGDEVFDGSVRHRLEQARVALVGASA